MKFPERGLYAITDTAEKSIATVLRDITEILQGGAVVVQYRDKNPQNAPLLARELVALCHHYGVPLIINDDIQLAALVNADGVHLGKDDGNSEEARNSLGADAIIGVSCYNSLETAIAAEQQGANYIAFGRFFSSTSKPLAAKAEISTLQQAKKQLNIPIVAIGGILPENSTQLLEAGADLLAVIGGLYTGEKQRAKAYQALFSSLPCV